MTDWPEAPIDAVARLRILAAGLPHAVLAERVVDAPCERVWSILEDLERSVPEVEWLVRSLTISSREGRRLRVATRLLVGPAIAQEVELGPGWYLMRAAHLDSGLAVAPERGERRTRVAHFERVRGLGALAVPFLRRKVQGDLARLDALVRRTGGAPPSARGSP